jgi:hypothetical protein
MATENIPFRGRRTCICVVRIVPLVEAEMKKRGLIRNSVDFFQMGYNTGGVTASAGTHDRGGAIDVAQYTDAHLVVWRMFGVRMMHRTPAERFSHHGHGWPGGCPHMSSGLRYQESEWRAKRNGLVNRKAVTGPGWTTITWQEAVKKYGGKPVTPAPAPAPAIAKDILDMATWVRFATNKDQPLPDRKWAYLKINDKGDVSFGNGPSKIIGTLSLRIVGLPPGQAVQVQVVEDDVDGKTTKRMYAGAVHDVVGSPPGDSFRIIPIARNPGKAAKGQRRLRIVLLAPTKGVRVTWNETAYWKA